MAKTVVSYLTKYKLVILVNSEYFGEHYFYSTITHTITVVGVIKRELRIGRNVTKIRHKV